MEDIISAVSTAVAGAGNPGRSIIRLSGAGSIDIARGLVRDAGDEGDLMLKGSGGIFRGFIEAAGAVSGAAVYSFAEGRSYTGEEMAEVHIEAAGCFVEAVMEAVMHCGARQAEPGEFTKRAYLNGRMDISQAEAVAMIVASANEVQLAAAEKLLEGKLSERIELLRGRILSLVSLLEAGLDFSGEDIEFISDDDAIVEARAIERDLRDVLRESVANSEVLTLPGAAVAGLANAGKSTLVNKLLGIERSIVSGREATTRDVLRGVMGTERCRFAIFDCAGLSCGNTELESVIEIQAQRAAWGALGKADVVIFCVDSSKDDFSKDAELLRRVEEAKGKEAIVIAAATKFDLVEDTKDANTVFEEVVRAKLEAMSAAMGRDFTAVSRDDENSIGILKWAIEEAVMRTERTGGAGEMVQAAAVNARNRQAIEEASDSAGDAAGKIKDGESEVAAMLLRQGWLGLGRIGYEHIDEELLGEIFSQFCIGK
jgi:tRNA modification GTPase